MKKKKYNNKIHKDNVFIDFNGTQVWRSIDQSKLHTEAGYFLRRKYQPGEYSDPIIINNILKDLYGFYYQVMKKELDKINYLSTIDFIYYQHEQWTKIFNEWRNNKESFSEEEDEFLKDNIPTIRRAMKHIIETLCLMKPSWNNGISSPKLAGYLGRAVAAAEVSFITTQLSNQTFKLFPNNTKLIVFPKNYRKPIDIILEDNCKEKIQGFYSRQKEWEHLTSSSYEDVLSRINSIVSEFPKRLDEAFIKDYGYSFTNIVCVITYLGYGMKEPIDASCFIASKSFLLTSASKKLNISEDVISQIIDVFTLKSEELEKESIDIWKQKRKNRLHRRPIVQVLKNEEPYLIWQRDTL
ncbi:hypothetical protein GTO91_17255, partial [Heliobacterium undosum]